MEGFISSHEAKTRFGELLSRVENGEELVITRHDIPVARVISATRKSQAELQQLFDDIVEERKACPLNPTGQPKVSIRDLIDEGRS
ncbi:MAG: type II toxin-antitoxin system prevent-host-death family antitoxin [Verrucomicrobiota bacterium]